MERIELIVGVDYNNIAENAHYGFDWTSNDVYSLNPRNFEIRRIDNTHRHKYVDTNLSIRLPTDDESKLGNQTLAIEYPIEPHDSDHLTITDDKFDIICVLMETGANDHDHNQIMEDLTNPKLISYFRSAKRVFMEGVPCELANLILDISSSPFNTDFKGSSHVFNERGQRDGRGKQIVLSRMMIPSYIFRLRNLDLLAMCGIEINIDESISRIAARLAANDVLHLNIVNITNFIDYPTHDPEYASLIENPELKDFNSRIQSLKITQPPIWGHDHDLCVKLQQSNKEAIEWIIHRSPHLRCLGLQVHGVSIEPLIESLPNLQTITLMFDNLVLNHDRYFVDECTINLHDNHLENTEDISDDISDNINEDINKNIILVNWPPKLFDIIRHSKIEFIYTDGDMRFMLGDLLLDGKMYPGIASLLVDVMSQNQYLRAFNLLCFSKSDLDNDLNRISTALAESLKKRIDAVEFPLVNQDPKLYFDDINLFLKQDVSQHIRFGNPPLSPFMVRVAGYPQKYTDLFFQDNFCHLRT